MASCCQLLLIHDPVACCLTPCRSQPCWAWRCLPSGRTARGPRAWPFGWRCWWCRWWGRSTTGTRTGVGLPGAASGRHLGARCSGRLGRGGQGGRVQTNAACASAPALLTRLSTCTPPRRPPPRPRRALPCRPAALCRQFQKLNAQKDIIEVKVIRAGQQLTVPNTDVSAPGGAGRGWARAGTRWHARCGQNLRG